MKSLVTFAIKNGGNDDVVTMPNDYKHNNILSGMNPSIAVYKGNMYSNSRSISYKKIFSNNNFPILKNYGINQLMFYPGNKNSFDSLNTVTNIETKQEYYLDFPFYFNTLFNGLEDMRFVVWNDKLYVYGTRLDVIDGFGIIVIYELDENMRVKKTINVYDEKNSVIEKNWMAIPDKPFHFIYDAATSTVVSVNEDNGTYEIIKRNNVSNAGIELRGNTPLCRIDENTYITICHTSVNEYDKDNFDLKYKFKFVFYDNEFEVIKTSDWFVFKNDLCEFCCGLLISDGNVRISYSILDCMGYVVSFPVYKLDEFCEKYNGGDNMFDTTYFYLLALKNEREGLSSIPIFNYVACCTKPFENIHYESAIRVMAYWFRNNDFIMNSIGVYKEMATKYSMLFPERCEAYYILSMVYRIEGNHEMAKEMKSLGDKYKPNDLSLFEKYLNINFL